MTLKDVYQLCRPNGIHYAAPYDQWQQLADAIVEKAVNDYISALAGNGLGGKPAATIKAECERFFRSEWFTTLSPLDGETVIQKLSTTCVQCEEGVQYDEC